MRAVNDPKTFNDPDFIGSGFKKVDEQYVEAKPPQIAWGKKFEAWNDEKQIEYLKKLARVMNHAADLLQKERNELSILCAKQEDKIEQLVKNLEGNNKMLQDQMQHWNKYKHSAEKHAAKQAARIRELESGDNS